MNHLIEELKFGTLAITSIGLDGEELDQITFLPKPRISVYPGMLVLTALSTLKMAFFEYVILKKIPVFTSLGQMVLIQANTEGKVLLAGPSSVHDMVASMKYLELFLPEHLLIDGAFSRQSSANVADAVIYCVGGGYSYDLDRVIEHASQVNQLFSLRSLGNGYDFLKEINQIVYFTDDFTIHKIPMTSLLDEHHLFDLLPKETKSVYIPYALSDEFAKEWMKRKKEFSFKLILKSPSAIIVKEPTLKQLVKFTSDLSVLYPYNVIAVCMNPTSPYRVPFDKELMKKKLSEHIQLPILNVLEEGE